MSFVAALVKISHNASIKKLGITSSKFNEGQLKFFDGNTYQEPAKRIDEIHALVWKGKISVREYSSDPREPHYTEKHYNALRSFIKASLDQQIEKSRPNMPSLALTSALGKIQPEALSKMQHGVEASRQRWAQLEAAADHHVKCSLLIQAVSHWAKL